MLNFSLKFFSPLRSKIIRNTVHSNLIILYFSPYITDLDSFFIFVPSVPFPLKYTYIYIYVISKLFLFFSFSCTDWSLAVGQLHVHSTLPNIDKQISKASNTGCSAHIDTQVFLCRISWEWENKCVHAQIHTYTHTHTHILTHSHTKPFSLNRTNSWGFRNINKCYWVWNRSLLQIACFIPWQPKSYICVIANWRLGR